MRYSRVALGICLVLCSLAAFSQNDPKVEVFGGYSWLHLGSGGMTNSDLDSATFAVPGTNKLKNGFSGWTGEVQYNINDWVGVAADVSGNYGTRVTVSGFTGIPGGNSYTFLVGPVVQQSAGKLRPFAHLLFGFNRLDTDLVNAVLLPGTTPTNSTNTAFAMAFGGGVDWQVGKNVSLRLGQLDYLLTSHDFSTVSTALNNGLVNNNAVVTNLLPDNTRQNNFRFSTGVVYSFGGK
jgi:opacity protein-like surface antigen